MTGLEQIRRPCQRPPGCRQILRRDIRTRLDEPFVVERDAPLEPACVRHGAGHDEHVADLMCLDAVIPVVAPGDALEMPVALQHDELCLRVQEKRRVVFDAANEIARHRVRQCLAANENVHAPGRLCKEHRSLTR